MTSYEKTILAIQEMLSAPEMESVPFHRFSSFTSGEVTTELRDIFDPNQLFRLLTRLRMEKDYTLDYVYRWHTWTGFPVLYARSRHSSALETLEEVEALPDDARKFPFHTQVKDFPEGFFELELLRLLGRQFFLFWHAGYHMVRPVCGEVTLQGLGEIIPGYEISPHMKIPVEVLDRVRALSLDPTLEIKDETVIVGLVLFSPWGGFNYRETTYQADSPHTVLNERVVPVAKYDCGVMY